jgi:MerR family redox-sensitive transcriptional activator SoxR
MTIGEVARRSGLPSSTLRFYENEKLIRHPRRVSGRRDYDEDVFANLQVIRMALEGGFTIRQARALIHGFSATSSPSQRWRALATEKLNEIRLHLAQLHHAERLLERAMRCQCLSLAVCADLLLETEQAASEPMKTDCSRRQVPVVGEPEIG